MITGWGGGKNIFDEVYAPDALWHLPDRDIHGVERFKRYLTPYINALPDLNATIGDEIAEGEKVKVKRLIISRFTLRGTYQGQTEEFGPPTGRQIELKGMTISRIEGGKIVEEWQAYDNLSVMHQLGLAPEQ